MRVSGVAVTSLSGMSSVTPRGFSFIELLVAIFVIVLLTGVVSLNVGRGGADLQLDGEVRYLANLLSFSGTEAGLSAADHGLLIVFDSTARDTRYQGIWLRRFDQGWASPRAGTDVFVPFDSLRFSKTYGDFIRKGVLNGYVNDYLDKNRRTTQIQDSLIHEFTLEPYFWPDCLRSEIDSILLANEILISDYNLDNTDNLKNIKDQGSGSCPRLYPLHLRYS